MARWGEEPDGGDTTRWTPELARCVENTDRVLRRAQELLGEAEQEARTVRAARKHAALRAALTGELRRAEGWPLSTTQLRALVGRALAGGGVYPALRAMERAGACVRVRDRSPLASRSVYWCVPSSPFAAAADGWAR